MSACRHVSPLTSIGPTSELINTEPNRPLHLSEDHVVVVVVSSPHQLMKPGDHRRHRRM